MHMYRPRTMRLPVSIMYDPVLISHLPLSCVLLLTLRVQVSPPKSTLQCPILSTSTRIPPCPPGWCTTSGLERHRLVSLLVCPQIFCSNAATCHVLRVSTPVDSLCNAPDLDVGHSLVLSRSTKCSVHSSSKQLLRFIVLLSPRLFGAI